MDRAKPQGQGESRNQHQYFLMMTIDHGKASVEPMFSPRIKRRERGWLSRRYHVSLFRHLARSWHGLLTDQGGSLWFWRSPAEVRLAIQVSTASRTNG